MQEDREREERRRVRLETAEDLTAQATAVK